MFISDDMDFGEDLDFGDTIDEELGALGIADAIRNAGVKGRTVMARMSTTAAKAPASRVVRAQPTTKAVAVRKGTIPGAIAGALVGGVPGALLGGAVGHAVSSPVSQQIVRAISPSINRIQADLRTQMLQRQATLEHQQINRRDAYQRSLMDKVTRIERMLARPYMRSL